jgi:hypothetical protein
MGASIAIGRNFIRKIKGMSIKDRAGALPQVTKFVASPDFHRSD